MRIDVQVHIGRLGDRAHTAAELTAYLDQAGLDRAVVSNLDAASVGAGARDMDEMDANVAALEAARSDPRLSPLYWIRPWRVDSNLHALAGALDSEPFAGALLAPYLNGYYADDARLDRLMAVLARLEKPAFVLMGREAEWRPQRIGSLAKRHPRVAFILCASNPPNWGDACDCLRQDTDRKDSRIFLSTAHFAPAELADAVGELGPERFLFGSDALCFAGEHARHVQKTLATLRETLPQDAFDKVTGENAAAFLNSWHTLPSQ